MSTSRGSRTAFAGVVYVVLVVASLITVGVTPSVEESSRVVSFYRDNNTRVLLGSVLFGLAAVAFLFFIGSLREALSTAEREPKTLASAAFAGGIVAAVGMLIFAALGVALADAADDVDPAALQAINALNVHMYLPLAGGIATLLIASGIVGNRTNVLPNWLTWGGIIIALLVLTPVGFFALLLSKTWVLATSVVMLRGGSPTASGMT